MAHLGKQLGIAIVTLMERVCHRRHGRSAASAIGQDGRQVHMLESLPQISPNWSTRTRYLAYYT
jgi:hypothetical protein